MKEVKILVAKIAEIKGLATSEKQAIEMGLKHYLDAEYASCYGGYRICSVSVETGGHSGALGESSICARRTKSKMIVFLNGYLNDL